MNRNEHIDPTNRVMFFMDGSPTDWLTGNDDWHSFAFLVLHNDLRFTLAIQRFASILPNNRLEKWGMRKKRYRRAFIEGYPEFGVNSEASINVVSFREQTLLDNYDALLEQYNKYTALEIGFGTSTDAHGRNILRHSFVHGELGLRVIELPESKMLVLLTLAWMLMNQCAFYYQTFLSKGAPPNIIFTIVTDNFSGDDHRRRDARDALQDLITHQDSPSLFDPWIEITTSPIDIKQPAEYIVDNFAGWINHCVTFPQSEEAIKLHGIPNIAKYVGWKEIVVVNNELRLKTRL